VLGLRRRRLERGQLPLDFAEARVGRAHLFEGGARVVASR
jgi:hypothetical protein